MEALPVVAGWAVNNLSPQKILKTVGIASVLSKFDPVHRELGVRISQNASILVRDALGFSTATDRWQMEIGTPEINLVVNAATESDVEQIVCLNCMS